jgi:uncharacterized protein (DUF1330 family)
MPAYVVVNVKVTDPVAYEKYKALAPAAIARHGGRYLVRGGATEVLEGEWAPDRFVVLEFPDADAARRWYDSPDYRAARDARKDAARMSMILADGL